MDVQPGLESLPETRGVDKDVVGGVGNIVCSGINLNQSVWIKTQHSVQIRASIILCRFIQDCVYLFLFLQEEARASKRMMGRKFFTAGRFSNLDITD